MCQEPSFSIVKLRKSPPRPLHPKMFAIEGHYIKDQYPRPRLSTSFFKFDEIPVFF